MVTPQFTPANDNAPRRGNAIPVLLSEAEARAILACLDLASIRPLIAAMPPVSRPRPRLVDRDA